MQFFAFAKSAFAIAALENIALTTTPANKIRFIIFSKIIGELILPRLISSNHVKYVLYNARRHSIVDSADKDYLQID